MDKYNRTLAKKYLSTHRRSTPTAVDMPMGPLLLRNKGIHKCRGVTCGVCDTIGIAQEVIDYDKEVKEQADLLRQKREAKGEPGAPQSDWKHAEEIIQKRYNAKPYPAI